MNDVREVFAEVLDTPAPPLASVETVLAAARRRARHRRWAWGTTGSTAALALAAAPVLVCPLWTYRPATGRRPPRPICGQGRTGH
jgi:hypothetical protein